MLNAIFNAYSIHKIHIKRFVNVIEEFGTILMTNVLKTYMESLHLILLFWKNIMEKSIHLIWTMYRENEYNSSWQFYITRH